MNNAVVDALRHEANSRLDPSKKGVLGQFMTPSGIAEFMASLFVNRSHAVLLDAGAGIGSLTLAASKVLQLGRVEAWEVDPVMQSYLEGNLVKTNAPHELHRKDFILDSVDRIQFGQGTRFTHAILNPPYKKIASGSNHRKACRLVGIETVNLYTAFLAMAILQMKQGGEIVIIIPRSFCNGPYYKPFREFMLRECSIDVLHVFESRTKAFKDDDVLQENIILKLTKGKAQGSVLLSSSHDASFANLTRQEIEFESIVKPAAPELFIRIPLGDAPDELVLFMHSLKELGLDVSTGPAVDFRLKRWWCQNPEPNTVPLIYPHHFSKSGFQHPIEHRKPNALRHSPEVDKWLMHEGVYVLVKRFSAKEEKRRVVAYLITPDMTKSPLLAFDNKWNVFHCKKRGLDIEIAKGLACFLNSTVLDSYFRVFSGHTQVNATDLRNVKYPDMARLRALGKLYQPTMTQEKIDADNPVYRW
jgi:adenine-specific DNA-methyltransferase